MHLHNYSDDCTNHNHVPIGLAKNTDVRMYLKFICSLTCSLNEGLVQSERNEWVRELSQVQFQATSDYVDIRPLRRIQV